VLEFTFWDVQHGNACYISTPNGRHIVIDLGIGSYGSNRPFSPLLHLKSKYGINQVDCVVITHPHRDHIDDIFNFGQLSPKTLWRPKYLSREEILSGNQKGDRDLVEEYLRISESYNQPIASGSTSDIETPEQWGGVKMAYFLTPDCNRANLNNHGIVSVFEYAGSKIIIPGDNEPESWKDLIKRTSFISAAKNADILLAPHHGRKSAYCPELFEAIGKVKLTVISDGPECDTSATGSYGGQSEGWRVYYPDDSSETRLCVTTRCDGVVRVRAYYASDKSPRLNVLVQKGSAKKS
jgi:competence protein ComEC